MSTINLQLFTRQRIICKLWTQSSFQMANLCCQMDRYSNSGLKTGLKKPVCGPKCNQSVAFHLNTGILSIIKT